MSGGQGQGQGYGQQQGYGMSPYGSQPRMQQQMQPQGWGPMPSQAYRQPLTYQPYGMPMRYAQQQQMPYGMQQSRSMYGGIQAAPQSALQSPQTSPSQVMPWMQQNAPPQGQANIQPAGDPAQEVSVRKLAPGSAMSSSMSTADPRYPYGVPQWVLPT